MLILIVQWLNIIILIALVVGFFRFMSLIFRALRKYVGEEKPTAEAVAVRVSLAQRLKTLRTERNLTQEFVAESLNVSRQAVSKWENGTSDPSTSNLFALAKLYSISVEELLRGVGE